MNDDPNTPHDGAPHADALTTNLPREVSGPLDPTAVLSSLSPNAGDDIATAAAAMLSKEPVWAPADYVGSGNFGGSAAKLSESFVAPLVAAARGYKTYGRDMAAQAARDFSLGDRRTSQNRRLMEAIALKDALFMPWFAVDEISNSTPTSIQFRPSAFLPGDDPDEKKRKYEFITGNATPLGAHPAMPPEWIDSAPTTLIAEGLLKADAALTGWLLHMGVTREQLSYPGQAIDARATLRALMQEIDVGQAVAVCSIAGVYNWQQNPEWKMVNYRDREVWLGIDGDVAVNPYVWRAASQFKEFLEGKKHARVSLLSPRIPAAADDGTTDEKIGIDDYLAYHGTWESLLVELSSTMPPRPADATAKKGDVRVSKDGCMVQQYNVVETDAMGNPVQGRWMDAVPLGGRVVASMAERTPSEGEIRTGVFGVEVPEAEIDWEVEVEVRFLNHLREPESHTITGPAKILNYLPEQWEGKGADIPGPVLEHPEWPPRGKDGEAWLKAVKGHEPDRKIKRVRWASMGWVPVPGSIPAFIAGDQIIGGDHGAATEALVGVTNAELDRASGFGVGADLGESLDDLDYRERVRQDIDAMLQVYVGNGTWRDRRNAAVVVAAGLRPALPLPMKALPYFVGARGTGKTFSAEACMGFWQAHPGSLLPVPGSAKDSAASIELALSRSVIWTIDDLAPASSRRQSEDEKDKIGSVIRNYFNRTARGRATADMKSRKKHLPRALLIITAENEPTVSSERDRVVLCDIGYGALSESRKPTDALTDMIKNGVGEHAGAPSRVSQALVKYLRYKAETSSWEKTRREILDSLAFEEQRAMDAMRESGGTRRHAEMAADLTVSLCWLAGLAEEVGCSEDTLNLLLGETGLAVDIISLVAEGQQSNRETSPGQALIAAIAATLRRGRAHIVDPANSATAPMAEDPMTASALGWSNAGEADGVWRPANRDSIGYLVHHAKTGEPIVLLDTRSAFAVAQQTNPSLVPFGQQERSSWSAVTGENLGQVDMLRVRNGKRLNSARVSVNTVPLSGYPVPLRVLLNAGRIDADE